MLEKHHFNNVKPGKCMGCGYDKQLGIGNLLLYLIGLNNPFVGFRLTIKKSLFYPKHNV